MRGTQFAELSAFVEVAQGRNFSKAANQLGIAPSTLSQTIRSLEERLGVRLLNRTTRSVATTEAGERLLIALQPAVESLRSAMEGINAYRDRPAGTLRLLARRAIATTVFAPMIAPFLKAYPEITVDAVSDDLRMDLVSNRFDAGMRIGELIERDMIAVKLIDTIRLVCVASPEYVAEHGMPKTPHELGRFDCIRHRWKFDESVRDWPFEKDGERLEIAPQGRLIVNEAQNAVMASIRGVGIAYLPFGMVSRFVEEKRLVTMLEDWCTSFSGIYIYYPSRRQVPAPLQAFIDFAKKAVQHGAASDIHDLAPIR